MPREGELALVLHTHMPYVEGFGTWPFGEEWLWEAIATCYLPLLDVLGRAPLTLSLTPVLCDQLEAPGATTRCLRFLEEIRRDSHRRDLEQLRAEGSDELVPALMRSAQDYVVAAERLRALADGPLDALGAHASWTSSATHAVLPLLATDAGINLQVQTGIASHRRRFGAWMGGFWLPECAYAPWLVRALEEAGVRSTCVELTSLFGLGDERHLQPLATDAGPVLWPIDREMMSLVWSDHGYPSSAAYRNYHGLSAHHHRLWTNGGKPYEASAAEALVEEHARDFVARAKARLRNGGVSVCALDTELLGHWWYEGVRWLAVVLDEASAQNLTLTTLDDALERYEPVPAPRELGVTTWGEEGGLQTWSAPRVAEIAWRARTAELRAAAAGTAPGDRALRELLALQSSDWAFLATYELAADYPRERARAHASELERALSAPGLDPAVRSLAPELVGWAA